jgi:hypothetical protein
MKMHNEHYYLITKICEHASNPKVNNLVKTRMCTSRAFLLAECARMEFQQLLFRKLKSIVTCSGFYIHDGTLLHSKSQYTTVKHSRQLFEHTYTSDLYGPGALIPIGFFQQDLSWQSSNTHSHSCSQKASKHMSGQSIIGLSVLLHTTTALRRIFHR